MNCSTCGSQLTETFKFCPECGNKMQMIITTDSLKDLLDTEIVMTGLIYNRADVLNNKVEFKLKDIIDLDISTSVGHYSLISYMDYNYYTDTTFKPVESYKWDKLNFNDKQQLFSAYYYHGEQHVNPRFNAMTFNEMRLRIILPILKLCNIQHSYRYNHDDDEIQERMEDILIALIENRIFDPVFGSTIIGSTNYDLRELNTNLTNDKKEEFIKINGDKIFTLSFKQLSMDYYDDKYMDKLFRQNNWNNADEKTKLSYKQSTLKRKNEELDKYKEIQQSFEKLLSKISCDLYYSPKNKKIYSDKELLSILNPFSDIYDLDLKSHCQLLKIKHINTYSLNQELEDLLTLAENYNRKELINNKFTLAKGVTKEDAIKRLISLEPKTDNPKLEINNEKIEPQHPVCVKCHHAENSIDEDNSFSLDTDLYQVKKTHNRICHQSSYHSERMILGKPLSHYDTITLFHEFPDILIIMDRSNNTFVLKIYNFNKELIKKIEAKYNSELFILNKELYIKKIDTDSESILKIYPTTDELINEPRTNSYGIIKIDEYILLQYNKCIDTSTQEWITFLDIYNQNWKLLESLKYCKLQCSCNTDLLVLKDLSNPDESYIYYNINDRKIVDRGCFSYWIDDVAVEYNKKTKRLKFKKF